MSVKGYWDQKVGGPLPLLTAPPTHTQGCYFHPVAISSTVLPSLSRVWISSSAISEPGWPHEGSRFCQKPPWGPQAPVFRVQPAALSSCRVSGQWCWGSKGDKPKSLPVEGAAPLCSLPVSWGARRGLGLIQAQARHGPHGRGWHVWEWTLPRCRSEPRSPFSRVSALIWTCSFSSALPARKEDPALLTVK